MRPGSFLLGGNSTLDGGNAGRFWKPTNFFFGGLGLVMVHRTPFFVLRNWDASKKNNQSQPQLVRGIFFCQWWDTWWENDSSSQLPYKAVPSNSHRFPL